MRLWVLEVPTAKVKNHSHRDLSHDRILCHPACHAGASLAGMCGSWQLGEWTSMHAWWRVYLSMATWQAPRCQKGQEEGKSRMEPPKAPPAFFFLPLLRIARLIQGVDYYDNRRITLEGGQWRHCYGAGGIRIPYTVLENCLSLFSQLVAHRQQSPTGSCKLAWSSSWFVLLVTLGWARQALCWNFASSFHF